jgi:ketosteroid isomerase-like protein
MFLLLIFVILFGLPQESSSATVDSVTQVEQRFNAALLKRDAVEFGALLANDLVHISFEGQSADKAEYMAFFKQGAWEYKKIEPTNINVKVLGGVAVVTGRVDRTIVVNNRETSGAFAFTHVWSRAGDRWQLTSSQLTTIPPSAPATAR